MQDHWNLNCLRGLKKLDYIFEGELSCDSPTPPQSDFNIISVRLEICQQSRGRICGSARLSAARPSVHSLSPLTVTSNYTRMETTGLVMRTQFGLNKSSLSLSLSVQLSGLAGVGQSPASGSWKSGSLDVVGRQRSSSDPPNMHPPVPPIRLISTGGTGAALRLPAQSQIYSVRV